MGDEVYARRGTYKQHVLANMSYEDIMDVKWLRTRSGNPSRALRERVRVYKENTWHMNAPLYVRPSTHNGIDVGLGLFAMVPFVRGQMICQFTGPPKKNKGRATKPNVNPFDGASYTPDAPISPHMTEEERLRRKELRRRPVL